MKITVEHNGKTLYGNIATVESTSLWWEDHGILTANLTLKWDGSGVSFGGYCLDEPKDRESKDYTRTGTAYGLDHIMRIMETIGVSGWEKVKGSKIVVYFDSENSWGSRVVAIGGLENGKIFDPKVHAEEWVGGVDG